MCVMVYVLALRIEMNGEYLEFIAAGSYLPPPGGPARPRLAHVVPPSVAGAALSGAGEGRWWRLIGIQLPRTADGVSDRLPRHPISRLGFPGLRQLACYRETDRRFGFAAGQWPRAESFYRCLLEAFQAPARAGLGRRQKVSGGTIACAPSVRVTGFTHESNIRQAGAYDYRPQTR